MSLWSSLIVKRGKRKHLSAVSPLKPQPVTTRQRLAKLDGRGMEIQLKTRPMKRSKLRLRPSPCELRWPCKSRA